MPTNPYSSPPPPSSNRPPPNSSRPPPSSSRPPPSGQAERSWGDRETHPGDPESRRADSETRSLAIRNLTKVDAGQLAGIIAVWEASDPNDRRLLAEFAQRLATPPRKPRE